MPSPRLYHDGWSGAKRELMIGIRDTNLGGKERAWVRGRESLSERELEWEKKELKWERGIELEWEKKRELKWKRDRAWVKERELECVWERESSSDRETELECKRVRLLHSIFLRPADRPNGTQNHASGDAFVLPLDRKRSWGLMRWPSIFFQFIGTETIARGVV